MICCFSLFVKIELFCCFLKDIFDLGKEKLEESEELCQVLSQYTITAWSKNSSFPVICVGRVTPLGMEVERNTQLRND